MPNPGADAPLRKVTLNLYDSDVKRLKAHYGQGWSAVVRDLVGDHARFIKRSVPKPTVGDLPSDDFWQDKDNPNE